MKRLLFAILVGLMLWTVGRWGLQAQGLHRAARELAAQQLLLAQAEA